MSDTKSIANLSSAELAEGTTFNEREVELIKTQIARGASDDELMHFIQVASSRGLDPFRKHIYAVKRWDSSLRREVMGIQVSIEGLRLIAERTQEYEGQVGPYWCGMDGQWTDVWLQSEPPAAAKIGVYRKGFREPLWGIAVFKTYAQTRKDGGLTQFWAKMPEVMIAKCAEAAALRRAFPEETGGLYVREEMDQAANPERVDRITGEVYDPDSPDGHLEMASRRDTQEPRSATKPTVQVETPADDEEARVEAMQDLINAADRNGFTSDDLELYFEYAKIDAETVTVERMEKITKGIEGNPVAFGEAVEKAKAQRELAPTNAELGLE